MGGDFGENQTEDTGRSGYFVPDGIKNALCMKRMWEMKELPVGLQDFRALRQENMLYVDKTKRFLELVTKGRRYFLSRPRRFGKSLTLSALEAMFSGRSELFRGLSAEAWVKQQSKKPSPVLKFDMSRLRRYSTAEELNESISKSLEDYAFLYDFDLKAEKTCSGTLLQVIYHLYKKNGHVVVLIDEYDKPILDNLGDLKKAAEMREILRSFYTILKSCDEYLRFVMLTGISKFSRAGVFSALNNLQDISMVERYGDIAGYTQEELEGNFSDWIDETAKTVSQDREELLRKIREYYDGFSFDGKVRVYNPFSILNFFLDGRFGNYWYVSGSPTFIVKYMKENAIQDPERYRHIKVSPDFADTHEIEKSRPESFLYQSGYLTIEKWIDDEITLDYPNEEVRKSLLRMYLDEIYNINRYITLGTQIWESLSDGNIESVVELYNTALSSIPYDDFPDRNEFWYRSLFIMLLRGAGIISCAEVHTSKGRSDVVIIFNNTIIILEFKYVSKSSEVEKKMIDGCAQINDKGYDKSYYGENRTILKVVLVANDEKRCVHLMRCP